MSRKPSQLEPALDAPESRPDPQADREPDGERIGPGREHGDEHIGPVAIARYFKDDGRALIVYTRDPHAPE